MSSFDKYYRFYMAQAKGLLQKNAQNIDGSLSIKKSLKHLNKVDNTGAVRIVSPVQQVVEQVNNQLKQSEKSEKHQSEGSRRSKCVRKRKRVNNKHNKKTHKLVKRHR